MRLGQDQPHVDRKCLHTAPSQHAHVPKRLTVPAQKQRRGICLAFSYLPGYLQSGRSRHGWLSRAARASIQRRDILGETTFRPIDQIETHARALLEGTKTLHLYGREMCEHIFSTFFWFNEAKPFDVVEPFHGSLSHLTPPEIPNV